MFGFSKRWWSRRSWLLFAGAIFFLGAFLRVWHYEEFPVTGETQDEVAWSLLGSSLLQTGQPVSWSYFSGYKVVGSIAAFGAQFPLVSPTLDHPPLFSLLPGAAVTMLGHTWKEVPSIKVVRFPMILLGVFNVGLFLWWISRSSLARSGRVFATMVFATAPSFVFLSRLVVSENLIVTWLIGLLLVDTFSSKKKNWIFLLLCAALPLTKVAGIAVAAAFLFELYCRRDWRTLRWSASGLLLGLVTWLLYAAHFDFNLFWHVQLQQSLRDTGLLTLFSSQFLAPTLVEKVFGDFWITLGFMATLGWLWWRPRDEQRPQSSLLRAVFIAQLAFIALSVGEHTVHGWYRIVFLPIFAFVFGELAQSVWENQSWSGLAVGWLVLAPQLRLALVSGWQMVAFAWQSLINKIWILLVGGIFFGHSLRWRVRRRRQLWFVLGMATVFLLIVLHTITVVSLKKEVYWQDELYWKQGIRP